MAEHNTQSVGETVAGMFRRRFLLLLDVIVTTCLLMTISLVILQVLMRFVLGTSFAWSNELARWAMVWMVFIGVPAGVLRESMLSVDFLSEALSDRWRNLHRVFVATVIAAAAFFLIFHGIDVVRKSGFLSPALTWPTYYLSAVIPASAVLTLLAVFVVGLDRSRSFLLGLLPLLVGAAIFVAFRYAIPHAGGAGSSSVLIVLVALILILLAVPIAFALILASYIALQSMGDVMLGVVSQTLTSNIDSFLLLAVPFFIVAAGVMNAGGITHRLVQLATALVGHFRGGLGQVNIITNTMMAGVSASSFADAAAIAKIMGRPMEKQGFERAFTGALTGSGAIIANLIPPSLALILYGALSNVSVGKLFVAGVIPGILMALTISSVVYIASVRRGYQKDAGKRAPWSARWTALLGALPALVIPIAIIGGLRAGMFTTTEAGAVAVIYACIIGYFAYRDLKLKDFLPVMRTAAQEVSGILFVVASSGPLAWILVFDQAPQNLAALLTQVSQDPIVILLLINLMLLMIGLLLEVVSAMVVLVPLLLPIVVGLGVDPVHFGIIIVVNLMMGSLTPPMGLMAFITARVLEVPVIHVFRALIPFLVSLLILLMALTFIPGLSLYLPRIIGA